MSGADASGDGARPGRVLAVLELRSNSMRMGAHTRDLPAALRCVEHAWVYAPTDSLAGVRAVLDRPGIEVSANMEEIVTQLQRCARAGDRIAIMSNGGFGGIHQKLAQRLAIR